MTEVSIKRGKTIFREGQRANQFYLLLQGEVSLTKTINSNKMINQIKKLSRKTKGRSQVDAVRQIELQLYINIVTPLQRKIRTLRLCEKIQLSKIAQFNFFGDECFSLFETYYFCEAVACNDIKMMVIDRNTIIKSISMVIRGVINKNFLKKLIYRSLKIEKELPIHISNRFTHLSSCDSQFDCKNLSKHYILKRQSGKFGYGFTPLISWKNNQNTVKNLDDSYLNKAEKSFKRVSRTRQVERERNDKEIKATLKKRMIRHKQIKMKQQRIEDVTVGNTIFRENSKHNNSYSNDIHKNKKNTTRRGKYRPSTHSINIRSHFLSKEDLKNHQKSIPSFNQQRKFLITNFGGNIGIKSRNNRSRLMKSMQGKRMTYKENVGTLSLDNFGRNNSFDLKSVKNRIVLNLLRQTELKRKQVNGIGYMDGCSLDIQGNAFF